MNSLILGSSKGIGKNLYFLKKIGVDVKAQVVKYLIQQHSKR